MGRYLGPSCRLCRREGMKLMLKGDRCLSNKCAVIKRKFPPGQIPKRRAKVSEYGMQLREKQKVKRYYGLMEDQFKRYFELASRKKGITGEILITLLEQRLDNVVYRMHYAASRTVPWLEVDPDKLSGKFMYLPKREEIDLPANEQLIVEFYSK